MKHRVVRRRYGPPMRCIGGPTAPRVGRCELVRSVEELTGEVELAGELELYEIEVQLLDGERVLDATTVSLIPREPTSFFDDLADWLRDNAVVVAIALFFLVLALATALAVFVRRDRAPPGES